MSSLHHISCVLWYEYSCCLSSQTLLAIGSRQSLNSSYLFIPVLMRYPVISVTAITTITSGRYVCKIVFQFIVLSRGRFR